jgi:carbamoyltransferase
MSRKPPVVLGVSALYHDAAAAVVRGGEILAAAQEERFTRCRHDARFPQQALAYCVGEAGGPSAIDAVAYYEDPALAFDRVLKSAIEAAPGSQAIWPQAATLQLGEKLAIAEPLTRHLGSRAADQLYTSRMRRRRSIRRLSTRRPSWSSTGWGSGPPPASRTGGRVPSRCARRFTIRIRWACCTRPSPTTAA